jgi:hypothetical protein
MDGNTTVVMTRLLRTRMEEQAMLRTLGKTVGGALAVLCLVSTRAVATERTCTTSDGKGTCTAAIRDDGKVVVVDGPGSRSARAWSVSTGATSSAV